MIDRRRFSAGLLASSLPMPALAQAATGSGGGGKGGDVVMAQQAQPPTLAAQPTTAQASRNITLHIFETLFARDEAGAAKPDLAEGVDVSSDGLT